MAKEGGAFRFAVVADTHGRPHPKTGARLAELAPDAILHAGDVGDLSVLDDLSAHAPVFAVRGNVDGHELPDELVLDVTWQGRTLLRILLVHMAVDGPRLRGDVARVARAVGASLVVCGHSHVPLAAAGEIAVFNPGAIGPRRFRLPTVLGTIDVGPSGAQLSHVDVETGTRWLP